jgi:hypothetical protein
VLTITNEKCDIALHFKAYGKRFPNCDNAADLFVSILSHSAESVAGVEVCNKHYSELAVFSEKKGERIVRVDVKA